jgi:hypothetical protein
MPYQHVAQLRPLFEGLPRTGVDTVRMLAPAADDGIACQLPQS